MPPASHRVTLLSATCLATVTHVPVDSLGLPRRTGAARSLTVASLASGLALAAPGLSHGAVIYSVQSRGPTETALSGSNPLAFTEVIGNSNSTDTVEYTLVGTTASRTFRLTSLTGSGTTTLSFTSSTTSGSFSVGTLSNSGKLASNGATSEFIASVTPTTRTGGTISGTFTLSGTNTKDSTVSSVKYTAGSSDITNFTFQTKAVSAVASQTSDVTLYLLPGASTSQAFTVKNIGDGTLAGTDSATFKSELWGTTSVTNGTGWSGSAVSAFDATTNNLGNNVSRTSTFTYTAAATRGNSGTASITGNYTSGGTNNAGSTVKTVFTGVTVAPVASTTTTGTGSTSFVLVGSGATVTGTMTVTNTGDGTLAGANLTGTLANTLGTGFSSTTAAGTISLGDSKNPGSGTSLSQTLTYTAESARSAVRTGSSVATFDNGSADGKNAAAASVTVSLSAQSVAPQASTTTTPSLGNVRVGTTATTSLTVKNIGDGNLAGADNGTTLLSNLRGNVTLSGPGTFTGGGAVNLTDSSSQTYMFTYAPSARGAQSATVTTAFTNGSADGKNLASNSSTTITATAVGPVYDANVAGKNASSGPIINGGTILFGEPVGGLTLQDLLISNLSNDNASKALTDLTLTNVTITGSTEFSFSLSGFDSGNTGGFGTSASNAVLSNLFNGDGQGAIAIQFVNEAGSGVAQLRLETDEGAALGGAGAVYVYNLVFSVPEPGTIAVFGAGLLGLAIARQRRRGRAFTALTANPEEDPPKAAI